jgi:hypothetical protein
LVPQQTGQMVCASAGQARRALCRPHTEQDMFSASHRIPV